MEYKIEEISPVKVKIDISIPLEEVDKAIKAASETYRKNVKLDGFRKGKAPAALVEKHFHNEIYDEARQNLIGKNIDKVITEIDRKPVSGAVPKGTDAAPQLGTEYAFSIEFEVLPRIDLPVYEGLTVDQEKAVVEDKDIDRMVERLFTLASKYKKVDGIAPAKDGQVANVDIEILEKGEPLSDLAQKNYDHDLDGDGLPEFDEIIKSIPVGNTGEKDITFPEDFPDETMAGKTLTVRVKVNAVKEKDRSFLENMEAEKLNDMREGLRNIYLAQTSVENRQKAEEALLDQLLKQVDFPLPESMVDFEIRNILGDIQTQLKHQGKNLNDLGKPVKDLIEQVRPQAENFARNQVLLMAIAQKENLDITEDELIESINKDCERTGESLKDAVRVLRDNGMIFKWRDRMLADKAMELVYSKANVEMVEPEKKVAPKETGEDAEKTATVSDTAGTGEEAGKSEAVPDANENASGQSG